MGLDSDRFQKCLRCFRRQSAVPARAIHPESDYFWVAAELGWPALLLVIARHVSISVGASWRPSVRVSGTGNDRKLRLAAAIGCRGYYGARVCGCFRASSWHDVLCALFFLGLALRENQCGRHGQHRYECNAPAETRPSRTLPGYLGHGVSACLGLLLASVGILFLCEERGLVLVPGQIALDKLRARAVQEATAKNYAAAEADVSSRPWMGAVGLESVFHARQHGYLSWARSRRWYRGGFSAARRYLRTVLRRTAAN